MRCWGKMRQVKAELGKAARCMDDVRRDMGRTHGALNEVKQDVAEVHQELSTRLDRLERERPEKGMHRPKSEGLSKR